LLNGVAALTSGGGTGAVGMADDIAKVAALSVNSIYNIPICFHFMRLISRNQQCPLPSSAGKCPSQRVLPSQG